MNAQKHVLRQILGARSILYRARNQGEHEIFVLIDQLPERVLIAGAASFDERALGGRIHPPEY